MKAFFTITLCLLCACSFGQLNRKQGNNTIMKAPKNGNIDFRILNDGKEAASFGFRIDYLQGQSSQTPFYTEIIHPDEAGNFPKESWLQPKDFQDVTYTLNTKYKPSFIKITPIWNTNK